MELTQILKKAKIVAAATTAAGIMALTAYGCDANASNLESITSTPITQEAKEIPTMVPEFVKPTVTPEPTTIAEPTATPETTTIPAVKEFEPLVCNKQWDNVDVVTQQTHFDFQSVKAENVSVYLESENELSPEQLQLVVDTTKKVYDELIEDGWLLPNDLSYCVREDEGAFGNAYHLDGNIHVNKSLLDDPEALLGVFRHEWTHRAQHEQSIVSREKKETSEIEDMIYNLEVRWIEGIAENRAYEGNCLPIDYLLHPNILKDNPQENDYPPIQAYQVGCVMVNILKEHGVKMSELTKNLIEQGREKTFENTPISWEELKAKVRERIQSDIEGEEITLISQTEIQGKIEEKNVNTYTYEFSNGLITQQIVEDNEPVISLVMKRDSINSKKERYVEGDLERWLALGSRDAVSHITYNRGEIESRYTLEKVGEGITRIIGFENSSFLAEKYSLEIEKSSTIEKNYNKGTVETEKIFDSNQNLIAELQHPEDGRTTGYALDGGKWYIRGTEVAFKTIYNKENTELHFTSSEGELIQKEIIDAHTNKVIGYDEGKISLKITRENDIIRGYNAFKNNNEWVVQIFDPSRNIVDEIIPLGPNQDVFDYLTSQGYDVTSEELKGPGAADFNMN